MKQMNKYGFFGTLLFVTFIIGSQVSADDSKVYTNKDLKSYERQYALEKKTTMKNEQREKRRKISRQHRHVDEQEYWCERGMAAQEKVERAKEKLAKVEEHYSEKRFKQFQKGKSGSKVATSEDKLEKAKEDLQSAERVYRKIDDEAHRKGIPPGWLRCQF